MGCFFQELARVLALAREIVIPAPVCHPSRSRLCLTGIRDFGASVDEPVLRPFSALPIVLECANHDSFGCCAGAPTPGHPLRSDFVSADADRLQTRAETRSQFLDESFWRQNFGNWD